MTEQTLLNERYQLEELLGSGGMAVVYRAKDLMLERPVAIKILRQNFTQEEEFRERFRQEARAAANLSHPNIVTIHDFGISGGFPFIVMEYVPGQHLKRLIKQQGAFHEDQALNLMIQACAGVGYAHRAGVVHCDIKPHNLIVTPDQQLKVTDFGISRALASIHPEEQSDVVWGSPQYFSPEQSAGGAPSPASDVYSLGVVMYEMLTGRLPFVADSSEELARLHQQSNPVPPHLINAEVSPELDHIVLKVMAKEPAMRYRTADQLGRILENYQAHPQAKHTATTNGSETALPETRVNQAVPVNNPPPAAYRPSPLPQKPASSSNPIEIDWVLIILGLLTVIAVGGLIPFWLWVFFSFNPLIP